MKRNKKRKMLLKHEQNLAIFVKQLIAINGARRIEILIQWISFPNTKCIHELFTQKNHLR